MSMMMKLINAAAGQSVGDEIYYVSSTTNSFRLVKIDFDAETVTVGTNKANGEYALHHQSNGNLFKFLMN